MSEARIDAKFDHAALFVTDLPAALEFYAVCGFAEDGRLEIGPLSHAFLTLEGSESRLQLSGPVAAADAGAGHLALRVGDVDDAYETLLAAGGGGVDTPHDIPLADARVAMVADPDGHKIELIGEIREPV